MPVQIGCECGKRYRVADEARGKRLRCKACGKELAIPRKKPAVQDEELEFAELDLDAAADDDDEPDLPPPVRRPGQKGRGRSASPARRFGPSDLAVRAAGVFVFLATLVNCAYQFHAGPAAADNKGPSMDTMTWAILPIPIGGLLGLYIAAVGEEPDPAARRVNRIAGLVKCGIGVGAIGLGAGLTFAVTVFLKQLAGISVVFTGLIIGGAFIIAYGGLSALTGRKFPMRNSD
jgi:hypothetical protein